MLAALSRGVSRLENYSTGADCASTLSCLRQLGCRWQRVDDASNTCEIEGSGLALQPPASVLDCGNSGSTMRMLSGILAGQKFESVLSGDESLQGRPMARVIEPLTRMGARIQSRGGKAPLAIAGGSLTPIDYAMPVASAQVKSAILFAGLFAEGETIVREPVATRDHSELALRLFGARLSRAPGEIRIAGKPELSAVQVRIPGDISSAAFFLCAAAIFPGSQLTIADVLLNPTRARLLDVLMALGLRISVMEIEDRHGELAGTLQAEGGRMGSATIGGALTAALIDELPVLAAIAPFTESGIAIRDARELRFKESDRIAAVAANLRAMGAALEEFEDGLIVPGRQTLHGAELDSFGDHRIAMAFAVAALRAQGETVIRNAQAADISFPDFFDRLAEIVARA